MRARTSSETAWWSPVGQCSSLKAAASSTAWRTASISAELLRLPHLGDGIKLEEDVHALPERGARQRQRGSVVRGCQCSGLRLHNVQNPGRTGARCFVALIASAADRRHKVFEGSEGVCGGVEVGGRLGSQAFGAKEKCGIIFVGGVLLGVLLLRRKYPVRLNIEL